jgi:YHS domain-containing protein
MKYFFAQKLFLISLFTLLGLEPIYSQEKPEHSNLKNNLALQGYDPVSYFSQAPKKGLKEIQTNHAGVVYYFTTESNKSLFLKSPEKYAPQYGGWCAYAMGLNGQKVSINPTTYKILDGKLYLFYNSGKTNTLIDWNKNEQSLKANGDTNWQKIIRK